MLGSTLKALAACLVLLLSGWAQAQQAEIKVGSKRFTESYILA